MVCAQAEERRSHVEVCAEGGVLVQQLARRISMDGGAALIADYGHDGTKGDTFRVRAQATSPQSSAMTPNKPQVKELVLTGGSDRGSKVTSTTLCSPRRGQLTSLPTWTSAT